MQSLCVQFSSLSITLSRLSHGVDASALHPSFQMLPLVYAGLADGSMEYFHLWAAMNIHVVDLCSQMFSWLLSM
jgi:hypothetical protein